MHQNKISRLLFELSKNCRITTKEVSKLLSISQQAASYTIHKLTEEKTVLSYQTIVDPAKLGLLNIIVLFQYQNFDQATINAMKRALKQDPTVTRIEEVTQGGDLLVEYSVPNLSYFNKQHKSFLYTYNKDIKVHEINVVIVKHHYTKNYLHKRAPEIKEYIISGDREQLTLSDRAQNTLQHLIANPKIPIATIATKVKTDPKTITKTKKWLERHKIIRGYSAVLNYEQLDITREHLFITLDLTSQQEEKRFLEYCLQHKNITSVTKTIGPYDVMITTERLEKEKSPITDLRKEFTIKTYQIINAETVLKYDFLPQDVFESNT